MSFELQVTPDQGGRPVYYIHRIKDEIGTSEAIFISVDKNIAEAVLSKLITKEQRKET